MTDYTSQAISCPSDTDCSLLWIPPAQQHGMQCACQDGPACPPNLASCCTGPVFNTTTTAGHPNVLYCAAYDDYDVQATYDNPYGYSDFFLCLTDDGTEASDFGVVCNDFGNVTAEESSSIAAYTAASRTYRGDPPAGFCYEYDCGSTSPGYGITSTMNSGQVTTTRALTTTTSSGQTSASASTTSTSNEAIANTGAAAPSSQTSAKSSSASGLRISRKLALLGILYLGSSVR